MHDLATSNQLILDEELDLKCPLRHFMDDIDCLLSSEAITRPAASMSELLHVLPQQSHSVEDGLLKLSFSHVHEEIPSPLSISLVVDASPGCGGIAWPAGQILASYLVQKGPEYLKGKNTLELGSGTGLVGLVAGALSEASVCITDQVPLLPIMRQNVALNRLDKNVSVAELNWGSLVPREIPRPDVILAADCVYFEPAFPLLVQTLIDLSEPGTDILFCYKKRRKADKRFFNALKKHFTWEEVMDDLNRQIYCREAISLLRISKMKDSREC